MNLFVILDYVVTWQYTSLKFFRKKQWRCCDNEQLTILPTLTEGGAAPSCHCYLQPSTVDLREWGLVVDAEVNSYHLNATEKRTGGQARS